MPRAACRGHQHHRSPFLNSDRARVRAAWLLLPWMAMAVMSSLPSCSIQAVGAVLGAGEHQHLEPVCSLMRWDSTWRFWSRFTVDLLGDGVGGGVAAGHFDEGRLVQQAVRQGPDLIGEVAEKSRF